MASEPSKARHSDRRREELHLVGSAASGRVSPFVWSFAVQSGHSPEPRIRPFFSSGSSARVRLRSMPRRSSLDPPTDPALRPSPWPSLWPSPPPSTSAGSPFSTDCLRQSDERCRPAVLPFPIWLCVWDHRYRRSGGWRAANGRCTIAMLCTQSGPERGPGFLLPSCRPGPHNTEARDYLGFRGAPTQAQFRIVGSETGSQPPSASWRFSPSAAFLCVVDSGWVDYGRNDLNPVVSPVRSPD